VDRLEAVAHVGQGAPDDHGHRVVHVRRAHLVFDEDGDDGLSDRVHGEASGRSAGPVAGQAGSVRLGIRDEIERLRKGAGSPNRRRPTARTAKGGRDLGAQSRGTSCKNPPRARRADPRDQARSEADEGGSAVVGDDRRASRRSRRARWEVRAEPRRRLRREVAASPGSVDAHRWTWFTTTPARGSSRRRSSSSKNAATSTLDSVGAHTVTNAVPGVRSSFDHRRRAACGSPRTGR
jgi:hypothetical protein